MEQIKCTLKCLKLDVLYNQSVTNNLIICILCSLNTNINSINLRFHIILGDGRGCLCKCRKVGIDFSLVRFFCGENLWCSALAFNLFR